MQGKHETTLEMSDLFSVFRNGGRWSQKPSAAEVLSVVVLKWLYKEKKK